MNSDPMLPNDAISALNRQHEPTNVTASWIKSLIESNTKLVVDSISSQIDLKLDRKLNPVIDSLSKLQAQITETKDQANAASILAQKTNAAYEEQNKELLKLRSENEVLRQAVKSQEGKITALDNYSRRSNLIFDGISEQSDETQVILLGKIQQVLNNMKIQNCKAIKFERFHRLGHYTGKSSRPVIVRFSFYQDRELVWSHKKNLKGTQIYVREDFCRDTLEYRQSVIPILKAARANGKKCVLVGDALIIDGQRYQRGNLDSLPQELKPRNLASKRDNSRLAFFGIQHPLSNFYPATFTISGIKFSSVEQYYQYQKALFFKDDATASKIMGSDDPLQHKRLSRSIRDFCEETWEPSAKEAMHNGVLGKFSQDPALKEYLCGTGDLILLEASPRDLYWGTGCSLTNPNVLNTEFHKGFNYLGEILMSVRSQLKTCDETIDCL